jgi:hypothetical protein
MQGWSAQINNQAAAQSPPEGIDMISMIRMLPMALLLALLLGATLAHQTMAAPEHTGTPIEDRQVSDKVYCRSAAAQAWRRPTPTARAAR